MRNSSVSLIIIVGSRLFVRNRGSLRSRQQVMRINGPSRRVSIFVVCAVLFLGFTVLGWGTGYKVSLYHRPGGPSSSIPVAKLLSQKERPSTTQAAEGVLPLVPNHEPSVYYVAIIVATFVYGLRLSVSPRMREVALDDSCKQRSAHSNFFFFRPPPALLPSN